MAQIQLLDAAKSGCKAATLPITVQPAMATYNSTTDGTTAVTIAPVGANAPYGGSFINKGCSDLIVTISFIVGGNCESCDDPDALTTTDILWTIPANSISPIPDGFWTELEYVLATAANDSKVQTVKFQSSYTPDCPTCAVLLADVA